MGDVSDTNDTEDLPRRRCLELLGSRVLGRVALSRHALPTVVPVTYRLVGDRLIFLPPPDSRILVARPRPVVAVQVDDIDPGTFTGWSVVVVGAVEEIAADPSWGPFSAADGARRPGAGNTLAALTTDHISGRWFGPINAGGTL